tara:strand:+ start:859 stop:1056 length:198 start_codon:yes stop_codon:yes gene_type:complete
MLDRWFGFRFVFKWPHDGFVFGFAIDYYEPTEGLPWESYVFRIAVFTIIYDWGWGEETKQIYNNQ